MSATEIGLAILAVTLGAVIQASVGFGAALVSVPFLLLIDHRLVPGPVTVASLALNVLMFVGHRRHLDRPGVAWALPGLVPGTALAGVALASFGDVALAVLSGVAILVGVGLSAVGRRPPHGRATFFGAGLLSGFMGTTAAVSGPPLALVWQDATADTIRGTLPPLFLASSALTLATLAVTGHLPAADWAVGAVLAPGGVLGFLISRRITGRGGGSGLRWAVLALSAVSAVAAIVRALA